MKRITFISLLAILIISCGKVDDPVARGVGSAGAGGDVILVAGELTSTENQFLRLLETNLNAYIPMAKGMQRRFENYYSIRSYSTNSDGVEIY